MVRRNWSEGDHRKIIDDTTRWHSRLLIFVLVVIMGCVIREMFLQVRISLTCTCRASNGPFDVTNAKWLPFPTQEMRLYAVEYSPTKGCYYGLCKNVVKIRWIVGR